LFVLAKTTAMQSSCLG